MRLIIKDYLLRLKEKDELDLLLCDVLFQKGYITENRPKTGNRQYGVDIRAHTEEEILLCVVKQGNLTRQNWNSGPNAVRQSLDEIQDCYVRFINGKDRKKNLHIVVATNGMIDEAVRPDWEGYKEKNIAWDGMRVKIDFWNIDTLTEYVLQYLFDEHVFDLEMHGTLRRALYFIGDGDYRRDYYEQIIDSFFLTLRKTEDSKEQRKTLAGVLLASQMIAQYAADIKIYKIAIIVTEYLIIQFWKYLLENQKLESSLSGEWLLKFLHQYEKWNKEYYGSVRYCCESKNRIPTYNPVEQRVLLYEMLGHLITYAYYLSFKYSKRDKEESYRICNSIIQLLNNHVQFLYPPYDKDVGIISMLYRLLMRMGRTTEVCALLHNQAMNLAYYYRLFRKYPSPVDTFEDAVNIYLGLPSEEYIVSAFWGTMLEWMVLLEQKDLYEQLQQFLAEDLADITKCVWFLREKEELNLYAPYAMNKAGDGVVFEAEETFEKLKATVNFVMGQYSQETFSFELNSFDSLEFIVCRYYGYIVRTKRESSEELEVSI